MLRRMSSCTRSIFKFQPEDSIEKLLANNKQWAGQIDKKIHESNGEGQQPSIFWISCADSRYGDYSTGSYPGEILTHRNVANLVPNCDPSSQSALQLAMQVVGCQHIVVCGHTDCKGVKTALTSERVGGSLEAWLRNLRDVRAKYHEELNAIKDVTKRENRLAELNVREQVYNVKTNDIVREHIKKRGVQVHGLIANVGTGIISRVDIPEDDEIEYYAVD